MFAPFMVNAWVVGSIVAVVAAVVGFFAVLRGAAFAAHAIPSGSFAGAAAAALAGVNALLGLGVFSVAAALGITWLGRRGRPDVATALTLSFMLGAGSLFLDLGSQYAPLVYSLLFGEVLGISRSQMIPTLALAAVCLGAVAVLFRPLLLGSVLGEASRAQGVSPSWLELAFLALVALTTTLTVPVVGTLLVFSLMIGPPAAARSMCADPLRAVGVGVALALAIVWGAIAAAYATNYPVGFFVGAGSAGAYALARIAAARMTAAGAGAAPKAVAGAA